VGQGARVVDGSAPASPCTATLVIRNFGGNPSWAFAGVFDGHGACGMEAAAIVKDALPREILANKTLLTADPIAAIKVGHPLLF